MDATFRKLLTYSYNIIGSYEDAQDIVQDALEKYIHLDKSKIGNEINYLIKMVVNLSINFKNRHRKKAVYGVWLPEPVATDSPESKLVKEQTANYTLMVLMEKLNARERAVFILKEGFSYSHEEIADALDISPENSRQVLTRAKKTLGNASFKGIRSSPEVLTEYIQAVVNADVKALEKLFSNDVKVMADGGSKVKVVKDIEIGKEATAMLLQHVYALFLQGKRYTFLYVNHHPAICFWRNDHLYNCQVFCFSEEEKIEKIYSVVDPDKLKSLTLK